MLFYERRKIFLIIGIIAAAVLVVVIIVVVRLIGNNDDVDATETEQTEEVSAATDGEEPLPPKDPDKLAAETLARYFVERVGSYSNQSNFQNLTDMLAFMTPRMSAWADTLKKQAAPGGAYRGTTTKALTVTITDWKPGTSANIAVGTQRQEMQDDGGDRLYYQDAEIMMIFKDGNWFVDSLVWKQERQ